MVFLIIRSRRASLRSLGFLFLYPPLSAVLVATKGQEKTKSSSKT